MSNEVENEAKMKILDKTVVDLGEHFDSVRIFCSTSCDGDSTHFERGYGNFYAQYGQIQLWIIRQNERERLEIRKEDEE